MYRTIQRVSAMLVIALIASSALLSQGVSAQGTEEGFPLPANAAYCELGYLGPFDGCTPWNGVTVSYASADGTFAASCTTAAGDRSASCGMHVPFGATITASIDPSAIPAGYVLKGSATQTFEIPDGPPEGLFGGPVFVLLPDTVPEEPAEEPIGDFFLTADTAYCDPGYLGPFEGCTPWEGVTVSYESTDAPISTTCVTELYGGPTASCGIPVPYGSTITVSIDPGAIPAGYVLERDASQTITIPDGPPDGELGGASFVLLPADDTGDGEDAGGDSDGSADTEDTADIDDPGPVVTLPNTGTGAAATEAAGAGGAIALIAIVLVALAGANAVRRRTR